MTRADQFNAALARHLPAFYRCLSPLGRVASLPDGIPRQSEQARGTRLDATIGQVTDGRGQPMPMRTMEDLLGPLDRRMSLLYAPQAGHLALRRRWLAWQLDQAGRTDAAATLPIATHGLTHGLSIAADLFADPDTTVVLPSPAWENYDLVFTLRSHARITRWSLFKDTPDGPVFAPEHLADALASVPGKALVILNFPSNPTGWSPTPDQAAELVRVVTGARGPAVVVVDDAYQGVVHTHGLLDHSLFWQLSDAADPERTAIVKVDGATKELLFFPSRLGFFTASHPSRDEQAAAAVEDKVLAVIRSSVGSAPGPSQAIVSALLDDPVRARGEVADRLGVITSRWRVLRDVLDHTPSLPTVPFNSAYFAMLRMPADVLAEDVRQRLLGAPSVGVIALPEVNALRVAYCSLQEAELPELIARIAAAL